MLVFDRVDLDFILRQILMAEAGQPPVSPHLAFGLRQIQGTNNNTSTGIGGSASTFGSVDQSMPLFAPNDQIFLSQYVPGTQFVFDSAPRTISNLIADQTAGNPAAVQAFMAANGLSSLVVQDPVTGLYSADPLAVDINGVSLVTNLNTATGTFDINPAAGTLSIPNLTPDGGISAPFNTWFTLFGQFFDHGLDMITKSGAGPSQELVFITLKADDPLITLGPDGIAGTGDEVPASQAFMVMARAKHAAGSSTPTNLVTPFVDNNQTYTSHPSHQVFLREYTGGVVAGVNTGPVASTGELLNHLVFNADGTPKLDANGNQEHTLPTWADVKANALKLGIILDDHDVGNVPLLATDAYGNLILGAHGLAQVVVQLPGGGQRLVEGTAAGLDLTNPFASDPGGVVGEAVLRIGHAFINDMAATAAPFDAFGNPLVDDNNGVVGGPQAAGTYDGDLLDKHYVAGDGRVNENIGLTTVHQIFENEHNRLVQQIRDTVQGLLNAGDSSEALNWVHSAANLALTAADAAAGRTVHLLTDSDFNGERLFQAAKFGTETQYQHLVFEEFARKVVPTIHVAGETNIHLDPAITAEFANAVYRFGHSMLNETIQVQDVNADGSPKVDANGNPVYTQEGLITAFTNPLDFVKYGASGIVQGAANQVGNEIDEFVTGALRNNLLGLPLDLAAINIARGRDTGIPTLNAFRNEIYQQSHDANLKPYLSWDDFRHYLKHDASIVNFVAAYGNYDDIKNAATDVAKRQVALELVNGTHVNSVTGVNDSSDFMLSRGIYANVQDPTAAINATDPRLLHAVELDPVTHQPVLDGSGNPIMEVAHWSTGSVTGLDNIDMWIGGLAEKQSLNGSLLGSTFELIFRVQLENLQDADRLYYLPRIEGTHFSDQIENNTFADLIQRNLPGAHHLPAAIFMTPEYNIEAKDFLLKDVAGTVQLDGSGYQLYDQTKIDAWNAAWNAANNAGNPPKTMIEITAKGELHFNGEDYFFGNTIVVGGTDGADKLLSGNADDDTVWGDGGNDIIDGGGGNDNLFGGRGNDLITDQAGANVVHGDEGNDTIILGKGADAVTGGDGNDLVYAGGGDDTVVAGVGNDIVFGGEGADFLEGDQGDDWLDGRSQANPKFGGQEGGDEIFGDVGAPTGQLPLYDGNDVMIGSTGTKMKGFGGDDIILGVGGMNKFYGGTGFDWASFELETQSVSADMKRREFVSPLNPLAGDGFRTVFTHVEGISGSQFGDELKGEDVDKAARILAKDELYNFNLVHGLVDLNFGTVAVPAFTRAVNGTVEGNFFAQGTQSFGAGDIMLGGGGSDRLQGGGGNDMLDGDAYLHVDLTRDAAGEIFAGSQIIREIRYADKTAADARMVDTAVYADAASNFTVNVLSATRGVANAGAAVQAMNASQLQQNLANGSVVLALDGQGFATITHNPVIPGGGAAAAAVAPKTINEGTDLLRNIERLEFGDGTVVDLTATTTAAGVATSKNFLPTIVGGGGGGGGAPSLNLSFIARDPTGAPAVGDTISLAAGQSIQDGDLVTAANPTGAVTNATWQWQYQDLVAAKWIDVNGATNTGAAPNTFVPGDFYQGLEVRLKASYTDGKGYQETLYSAPLGGAATPALLLADPAKNAGPTAKQRVVDFVNDTTAYQGEAVNIYIPVVNKFVDDHTASAALTYAAFIVDAAGTEHDITVGDVGAAPFSGLSFAVVGAPGAVTGANITGTLPAGINGPITVRLKVSDNGTFPLQVGGAGPVLTTTTDFQINIVNAAGPAPGVQTVAAPAAAEPSQGLGVHIDRVDLDFILTQIKMAEANHAFGTATSLSSQPPTADFLAFGLRTVSAVNNSAVPSQSAFGQSDQVFPRLTTPVLGMADAIPAGFFGPGSPALSTNYAQTSGFVFDSDPRLISNLIADQSANNPAALAAALSQATVMPAVQDPSKVAATDGTDITGVANYSIPNVTPDGGISAPFNTWFTLFGQFFDHGLDLVNKGGNGQVIIPILPGDPLYVAGGPNNFMVLNRATLTRTAGADGIIGTADDGYTHDGVNAITPPVDLSQVFASHAAHQVFLREYINDAAVGAANPNYHSTGKMLTHLNADGSLHLPTWADVKVNALNTLGLRLSDYDVVSVPLVLADEYGNVVRGAHGYAQVVYQVLARDNATGALTVVTERTIEGTAAGLDIDHIAVPAGLVAPANSTLVTQYVGAGVAFINDMARAASPFDDFGRPKAAGAFDSNLLGEHFIAGDGRVNENIGLTSIHDIFLSEFNRMVDQTKGLIQDLLNKGDTAAAMEWVLPGTSLATNADGSPHQISANEWNGERIFQAARFSTETQYQHLVFEEFARKIAPDIHLSGDTNIHLDPAVFAEFAHTVYRFGHSMLDENLQRFSMHKAYLDAAGNETDTAAGNHTNPLAGTAMLDANGLPMLLDAAGNPVSTDIALLTAFTNPLAYEAAGKDAAAQLALGGIAQVGNEIDEFVTGTLRNNLLGAPLDLAALNIARGRSEGVPTLNMVRNELYSQTGDHVLKPYDSWHEFGQFLKHPESLINFVAAYGTGVTGTAAERRADATLIVTAGENDANHGNAGASITLHNGVSFTVADAWNFMHSAGSWANIDPANAALYNADPRAIHGMTNDAAGNPILDPNPPTYSTGSITGLDAIDFWIGGLAEKQNLHDSMLGSTFDFVFKLQMENLQDADRLYYLPRIEGTQFSDQIEGNTFASMVMNATGAKHLSASIFLTPEYQIEANSFYQHDADGQVSTDANGNAIVNLAAALPSFTGADGLLHPLVEVLPDGTVHFLGEDNFFGNTMVLGGTDANDKLMAGQADDDTVYGDGGNDVIDGGGGNDNLFGGDGNDILSNSNSSIGTMFHGDAGDDIIYGSKGDDGIFGGDGNDLIYGGQGVDDIVGGAGNDIIFGGEGGEEIQGDEGDDWIDGGPDGGDVLFGDVGAPTGGFPLYAGNDVMIGGPGTVMKGFSGDDIMLGVGGMTKFDGGLGFDWASFESEAQAVDIDMSRREFIADLNPAGGDGFRDVFQLTEAASGSKFDDHILGDNKARVVIAKNTLDNPTLIKGLADVGHDAVALVEGATTVGNFFISGAPTGNVFAGLPVILPGGGGAKAGGDFGGGNILLGGAGNDVIQGGNGDDIIDGDAYLHVELLKNAAGVVGLDSQILREIRYDTAARNVDTAVYSGTLNQYSFQAADARGFVAVVDTNVPPVVAVAGVRATNDGVDLIRNIERLQFADGTYTMDKLGNLYDGNGALVHGVGGGGGGGGAVDLVAALGLNHVTMLNGATIVPDVSLVVNTPGVFVAGTPEVGKALTIGTLGATNLGLTDKDFGPSGAITNVNGSAVLAGQVSDRIHFQWQYLDIKLGDWVTIADPHDTNPLLASNGATSASFTPGSFFLGQQIRAIVSYVDPTGYTEVIHTAPPPGLLDVTRAVAGDVNGAGVAVAAGTAVTIIGPRVGIPGNIVAVANTGPDVVLNIAHNGFDNTSAQQDKPIQGMFLPLTETFHDNETANVQLGYKAEIIDSTGVAHLIGGSTAGSPGTALAGAAAYQGLSFTVDTIANAAGGLDVADGHITGTPTNVDGSAAFTGNIHVRITATDQGTPNANGAGFVANSGLATTAEFDINVLSSLNNAPVLGAAQTAMFKENVAAGAAVAGAVDELKTAIGTTALTLTATDTIVAGQPFTPLTWSITNGANLKVGGLDLFTLAPPANVNGAGAVTSTEVVKFNIAPDFEAIKQLVGPASPDVTISADGKTISIAVKVAVSDGQVSTTQTETVIITNVDEKATGSIAITSAVPGNGGNPNNVILTTTNTLADPDLITAANPTGAVTTQWQTWNGTAWVNVAGNVAGQPNQFSASGQTVRAIAAYTDAFGAHNVATDPASTVTPQTYVVGTSNVNTLLGTAPAGLLANGHDRTFMGLGSTDTVDFTGDTTNLTINLVTGKGTSGTALGDTYNSIENFTGGNGNDRFIAAANNIANTFNGGTGANIYDLSGLGLAAAAAGATFALAATKTVTGAGLGTDTLVNIQSLVGSGGTDTFNYTFGVGAGAFAIDGGAGSDTLNITGTGNSDTLTVAYNGTAIVSFTEGASTSTVSNIEAVSVGLGGGTDTLSYGTSASAVTVNLTTGTASGLTSIAAASIENVTGGSGNDVITGNASNNVLIGGAGDDTFNYAIGGAADTIDGGVGTGDKLNITGAAANDTLTVSFNGTVLTGFQGGTITGVESVVADLGGGNADVLSYGATTAGVIVNTVAGTASGFTSVANIENFTGGSGVDKFIATNDAVANLFDGAGGIDTADYSAVTFGLVVNINSSSNTAQQVAFVSPPANPPVADAILHIENFTGGSAGNQITINANDTTAAHVLKGGAGLDIISGGAGSDTVIATVDNAADVYNGGGGTDTADYSAYTTALQVSLNGNTQATVSGSGNDRISNFENFIGGSGADSITGDGNANVLTGGAGNDSLRGAAGIDTFVFNAGFGNDHITDFAAGSAVGHDLIDVSSQIAAGSGFANGAISDINLFLAAHAAVVGGIGGHVQLTFGVDKIDLDNVATTAQLVKEDFIFH